MHILRTLAVLKSTRGGGWMRCYATSPKVAVSMPEEIIRSFDFPLIYPCSARLCGLAVRVPGYRSGGPMFDSWHYKKQKEMHWVWNGVHSAS
jgi:hypothetical protein